MNCAGIIRKLPEGPIVVPPIIYNHLLKRLGKEYVEKNYIKDQKAKPVKLGSYRKLVRNLRKAKEAQIGIDWADPEGSKTISSEIKL